MARLHDDIEEFLENREYDRTPPFHALSIESIRERNEPDGDEKRDVEPVEEVREFSIEGPDGPVDVRTYYPAADPPFPVLVWLHGGGWVRGGLDSHDHVCRAFANRADCLTVSVDYRLAPEHPFPAALKDCYAVLRWLDTHHEHVGADDARIAIGGQSSGGNLAASIAQIDRDFGDSLIERQVLAYPVTDYGFDTESYRTYATGYYLTRADMEWFWDKYLADEWDGAHPYASPLRAQRFEGLPDATILTCGFDPLRDEGIAYAESLEASGVDVDHVRFGDMIHGFLSRTFYPNVGRADEALDELAEDLRNDL